MTPHGRAERARGPLAYASDCLALGIADGRRKINLLQGRATPLWMQLAVVGCYVLGAVLAFAAVLGAGLLAARFGPVREAGLPELARYSWPLVVLLVVTLAAGTQPHQVRLLIDPPDRAMLTALPLRPGQVILVRGVLPALLGSVALAAFASVFLGSWLSASPAGRELLPYAWTLTLCTVLLGSCVQLFLLGVYARSGGGEVGLVKIRQLVVMAGLGGLAGWSLALVTGALREQGPLVEALPRILRDTLTAVQPGWWEELLRSGTWWTGLVTVAVSLPFALLGGCWLAAAGRHRMLRADAPVRYAPRPGRLVMPRSLMAGFLLKDAYAAVRGLPGTTAVLRLWFAGSVALGATGLVHAAVGGVPLDVPFPAAAAMLVGGMLVIGDEAVQTAGVEGERRAWDLLRQSPLSERALGGYKALSVAATTAVLAAPGALGWALLTAGGGRGLPAMAAVALAAAASCGAAATVTARITPPAEAAGQSRVTRAPSAGILQAVLTWVPLAPVLLLAPSLPGGTGVVSDLLACVPALVVLAVLAAAAAWTVRPGRRTTAAVVDPADLRS